MGKKKKSKTVIQGPSKEELAQRERQHKETLALQRERQRNELALGQERNRIAAQQAEDQKSAALRQERNTQQANRIGLLGQRRANETATALSGTQSNLQGQTRQQQTSAQSREESRKNKVQGALDTNTQSSIASILKKRRSRGIR